MFRSCFCCCYLLEYIHMQRFTSSFFFRKRKWVRDLSQDFGCLIWETQNPLQNRHYATGCGTTAEANLILRKHYMAAFIRMKWCAKKCVRAKRVYILIISSWSKPPQLRCFIICTEETHHPCLNHSHIHWLLWIMGSTEITVIIKWSWTNWECRDMWWGMLKLDSGSVLLVLKCSGMCE